LDRVQASSCVALKFVRGSDTAARRAISNIIDMFLNSENIDELLDNMRHVTENLKEFTATIKTRPYTLIRASNPREHKPGEQQ